MQARPKNHQKNVARPILERKITEKCVLARPYIRLIVLCCFLLGKNKKCRYYFPIRQKGPNIVPLFSY